MALVMETRLHVGDAARGINEDGENLQRTVETYKIFHVQRSHNHTKTTWSLGVSRARFDFKMT